MVVNNNKDPLIDLIKEIQKDKGGTLEDYLDFITFIGHLESGNDPTALQKGSEIGKGAFQFEGKNGSNRILDAAKRTRNFYKEKNKTDKIPEFVLDIINNGTGDASKLTYNQQALLLLGDVRMGRADLKDFIGKGKKELADYWVDYHWAGDKGSEKARAAKLEAFDNNINSYFDKRDKLLKKTKEYTGLSEDDFLKKKEVIPEKEPVILQKPKSQLSLTGNPLQDYVNNYTSLPTNLISKNIEETKKLVKDKVSPSSIDLTLQKDEIKTNIDETKKLMRERNNQLSLGGIINSINTSNKDLNQFNTGGLHSQNRLGGIPIGQGSNGKTNTVEEGETSFETKKGKFIFSNRIKI